MSTSKRGVSLAALIAALLAFGLFASSASAADEGVAATPTPVNNDCSGGRVAFTFDDGPGPNTQAVIDALKSLNLTATFMVNGNHLDESEAYRQLLRDEIAAGYVIGNHGYNHSSFTGASSGGQPMTAEEVTAELEQTSTAIVNAGGSRPTLYRPPYGDVNSYYDLIARNLGYRIVMPWGANIIDPGDWKFITSSQIAENVINGYYQTNGIFRPGITADSIISLHDGLDQATLNSVGALQAIVNAMNSKHLCSGVVREDATGGVVPAPAPPQPTTGNLVRNPTLELLRAANSPAAEPVCFQQGGASVASQVATWTLTSDAHSGSVAERVDVSNWKSGDRKLVLTQRTSEASCLAAVTPGRSYSMWVWYKGNWAPTGTSQTKVSMATYYKNSSGAWVYWQGSPLYPPTSSWNLAYFSSAPLPAGATALSFGLAISGVGSLTTDDYAMTMN